MFSSAYLPLDFLKTRLLAGLYTPQNLPSDEDLLFIIELAEIRFEEWLGRRLVVTNYLERQRTNSKGVCLVRNFPVLEVHQVTLVPIDQFGTSASPLTLGRFRGTWWQGRRINTGRSGVVVEVSYTAGLDPLPRILYSVFYQLVYSILSTTGTTGDLSFLDAPTKDVASVSLPGGLSKSYRIGGLLSQSGGGGSQLGSSEIDRVLGSLGKYRNAYLT